MKNAIVLLLIMLTYTIRIPVAFILFVLALIFLMLRFDNFAYALAFGAFYILGIKDIGSPQ